MLRYVEVVIVLGGLMLLATGCGGGSNPSPSALSEVALPSVCTLSDENESMLTLQPGPEEGKDAEFRQPNVYEGTVYTGDENYGGSASIWVGQCCGDNNHRDSLEFDLSSIPQGAVIVGATLSLYVHYVYCPEYPIQFIPFTEPWGEYEITWNSQPPVGPTHAVEMPTGWPFVGDVQAWRDIAVTEIVQLWVDSTVPNYGWLIKSAGEGEGGRQEATYMFSSDHPNPLLRPKLTIKYSGMVVTAGVDFDPDTLNLKSRGKWVTCYIELPEGYDVANIDVSTILLNDTVYAEFKPTEIGDYDDDGILDLMIKFDRAAVQDILEVGDEVAIVVIGEVTDGTSFEATDTIRVIDNGRGRKID